jgi:hypothetical protein
MQRVSCWCRETFPGIDNESIFAGVNSGGAPPLRGELSKISHFLHAPLECKKASPWPWQGGLDSPRFCCNGVRVTISGGTCAARAFLAIVWEIILQDRGGHRDEQQYEKGCQERRGFIRERPPAETSSLAGHRIVCRRREVRACLHRQGQSLSICRSAKKIAGCEICACHASILNKAVLASLEKGADVETCRTSGGVL